MHVFIDDSGDGDFKMGQGSTRYLVIAAVIFHNPQQIEALKHLASLCADRNHVHSEFKFSKTKDRIKTCFFECTTDIDYFIRAIVIDKTTIYSAHLRDNPGKFKSWAIRQLLSKNRGTIQNAKIVIDGHDTKAFDMTDQSYLMRQVNQETPGTIEKIVFADSTQNIGIQLADMVAGSIHRHYRTGQKHSSAHFEMVQKRPGTLEAFGCLNRRFHALSCSFASTRSIQRLFGHGISVLLILSECPS